MNEGTPMPTAQMITDALRIHRQELDQAVGNARVSMKLNNRTEEFVPAYLKAVRQTSALIEWAVDEFGITGVLVEAMLPIPFRPQVMDLDPAEKFRRSWDLSTAVKINTAPLMMAAE